MWNIFSQFWAPISEQNTGPNCNFIIWKNMLCLLCYNWLAFHFFEKFLFSSYLFTSYTNVTLPAYYSVHINCGGKQVTVDGNTTFEDDTDEAGPSRFAFRGSNNWAFSNTGHFLDDDRPADTYIQTNTSILLMNDSQLYTRARISPISLTYYGFCLGNGNYTVSLHFAEIMFTNDKTYSSFGRRIFDVYIQVIIAQYFLTINNGWFCIFTLRLDLVNCF